MNVELTMSEIHSARDALARRYNSLVKRPIKSKAPGALSGRAMQLAEMSRTIDKLDAALAAHTAELVAELGGES